MAGFYFTKIPVLKIRSGRVMDEKPRVVSIAPVLEPTILSAVEVVRDVPPALSSTNVVPIPVEVIGDSSPFSSGSTAPALVAGALRWWRLGMIHLPPLLLWMLGVVHIIFPRGCEVGPKGVPQRGLQEEGVGADSGGAKKSQAIPPQETSGFDQVFPIEADELHSQVEGSADIKALHSENKALRTQLIISEDARAQAKYEIVKSFTIQKMCVQARRKVESQL
ncbi:hypothetical protein Adt_11663 [Abeliophyllum distichum]|uniref:Uncharacterized protein n=1 Tax=Abeliophyllum distichum TaxID=126358 RepID=A0ABD1UNK1_9LAMI